MKKFIFILVFSTVIFVFSSDVFSVNSDLNVSSKNAIVIDSLTGRVLYQKNAYERASIASLTKVMTSIMLLENCDINDEILVPKDVKYIGGSLAGLRAGEKVKVYDLLYAMLLPSGNDAAYTVGYHIGNGNIDNFATLMTLKAKEIGAKNTSFANPHGLDNPNHYSTAYDMAQITRYALDNKYINEAVNTKTKTVDLGSFSKTYNNTNALLSTYPYADGVKTGYTSDAGRCLITSATNGDRRFISVILGADTTNIRFSESKQILNYAFDNYKYVDISNFLNIYINIPVKKGNFKYYEAYEKYECIVPLKDGEYEKIYVKQNFLKEIVPPMVDGEKIGNIEVYIDDEIIYERNIFLNSNIYKNGAKHYIYEIFKNMFNEYSKI